MALASEISGGRVRAPLQQVLLCAQRASTHAGGGQIYCFNHQRKAPPALGDQDPSAHPAAPLPLVACSRDLAEAVKESNDALLKRR